MKRSAWRAANPPADPRGRFRTGPIWLLVGGLALALVGVALMSYGILLTFQRVETMPGGTAAIFVLMQYVGYYSVWIGAVMVAISFAWVLWRIAVRIWNFSQG